MKTYDYLRIGKLILAVVPRDGDSARTIQEAKAGFILSSDEQEMREKLREILLKRRKEELEGFHPDQAHISKLPCLLSDTRPYLVTTDRGVMVIGDRRGELTPFALILLPASGFEPHCLLQCRDRT